MKPLSLTFCSAVVAISIGCASPDTKQAASIIATSEISKDASPATNTDMDTFENPAFAKYFLQVQNIVKINWNQIQNAKGRVQVSFRIQQDGHIKDIRIETSSNNPELDLHAIQAIRLSDPLPKFPDSLGSQTIGVRYWFTYLGN